MEVKTTFAVNSKKKAMEIKWTDADPETGQRRFLRADRFAGQWRFSWKLSRRGPWQQDLAPTVVMWEHILDSLQRRYRRREGVEDNDIAQVEKHLADARRVQSPTDSAP